MDPNIVPLLQSMHERISRLEARTDASHTAVILMERACHAWMDVQRMMGASEETMRIAVQTAVKKALQRAPNPHGLLEAIDNTKLPAFFAHVMKSERSRTKALGMIKVWIKDVL